MKTLSIDFETFYDSKAGISVGGSGSKKGLGLFKYTACLNNMGCLSDAVPIVSVISSDDPSLNYVGCVKDAPWDKYADCRWVAHNAEFDIAIYYFVVAPALGLTSGPAEIRDTMHLAYYLGYTGGLKSVAKELLGIDMSKDVRDAMNGRRWSFLPDNDKLEFLKYGARDAEVTMQIWDRYNKDWAIHEQKLSEYTIIANLEGVRIDVPKLKNYQMTLEKSIHRHEKQLPWFGDAKTMSPKAFKQACIDAGIPLPTGENGKFTTSSKDEGFISWQETYSNVPWVSVMSNIRRLRRVQAILEQIEINLDGDIAPLTLAYCGTNTGRFASRGYINFQNLPRDPLYFSANGTLVTKKDPYEAVVDLRSLLIPREGKVFIISDLSQIEPRVTAWLTGDHKMLEMVRGGMDIYEAQARITHGYSDPRPLKEVDNALRQLCKQEVLSLAYGVGAGVHASRTGISFEEAQKQVNDYRQRCRFTTVKAWEKNDEVLRKHAENHLTLTRVLPSGRICRYWDVGMRSAVRHTKDGASYNHTELYYTVQKGDNKKVSIYGSKLFENDIQAIARDVFIENQLRLSDNGFRVLFSVHDEVIIEADNESQTEEVIRCMTTPPAWAKEIPLECSCEVAKCYKK